jgi:hypothetical protein
MTTMKHFPSDGHAAWLDEPLLLPLAGLKPEQAAPVPGLHVRVLRMPGERQIIAGLRRHAAYCVENDLGLGLQPFEQARDEIGHVVGVYRYGRLLASARAVPTGFGLTGAERLMRQVPFDASILGPGSWEIGRVIMEPKDRDPQVLHGCLSACMEELLGTEDARHFHATTTVHMARLWRRVGMRTVATATGASGAHYALVYASVADIMAALHLPRSIAEAPKQPDAPLEACAALA